MNNQIQVTQFSLDAADNEHQQACSSSSKASNGRQNRCCRPLRAAGAVPGRRRRAAAAGRGGRASSGRRSSSSPARDPATEPLSHQNLPASLLVSPPKLQGVESETKFATVSSFSASQLPCIRCDADPSFSNRAMLHAALLHHSL